MDPPSHHYTDDIEYAELVKDHFVTHVCAIVAYYHFNCDICKIGLTRILQEEGNYFLEYWQERTRR
jgi:hypothetical protein